LEGGAINTSDGRIKVLLEGSKKEILEFIERLKEEFPELSKNPTLSEPNFNEEIIVPDSMRISQSLQLNQFSEAVKVIAKMNSDMNEKFDNLPKQLGEELKPEFNNLGNEIKGLRKDFDDLPKKIGVELRQDIEKMPKQLAAELKPEFQNLPKQLAAELRKDFDKLPREIAKAIKETQN